MSLLRYVAESTYGTTPADSANWKQARMDSSNFTGRPITISSNEITSHGQVSDLYKVDEEAGGSIPTEFSAVSYDDWLESLFGDTFSAGVLKIAKEIKSFTFEDEVDHLSPVQFLQFPGTLINSATFSLQRGGPLTINWDFVAKHMLAPTTTSLVGAGSTAAAGTTTPMNATSDISTMELDGGAFGVVIQSLEWTIARNLEPKKGVGILGAQSFAHTQTQVTGRMTAYLDSTTLLTALLNQTNHSIGCGVSDGTDTYDFLLPRIKFSEGDAPIPSGNQPRVMTLGFTATYDPTEQTSVKLTKS